jgi:hypothetical protein
MFRLIFNCTKNIQEILSEAQTKSKRNEDMARVIKKKKEIKFSGKAGARAINLDIINYQELASLKVIELVEIIKDFSEA